MKMQKSTNGHPKKFDYPTQGELQFPVTYELKVVFDAHSDDTEIKKRLEAIFKQLRISHAFSGIKTSSKGSYRSYSYQVSIVDKTMMDNLYTELKSVPGLKTAL
jgi:putative lipoic acid-binding regulatory protein